GEIEAKLAACAGVREAVVLAREDVAGDKRLVAYVVAVAGAAPTAAELREALLKELPEYMVPSAFVELDGFPLTPNGKLDRKALPAPDGASLVQREYEAPQGEVEETLARLWSELLGVEKVGRNDHFFELGGHSLLVMTLVERLRTEGLRMMVQTIFTAPWLHTLATTLSPVCDVDESPVPRNLIGTDTDRITPLLLPLVSMTQEEIDSVVANVPGGAGNVQDIYRLLPLQEGLLFHHLLEDEGDTYLSREVLAFDRRERLDAFLGALNQIIDRHDILRSAVHWEGLSQPVQVVYRSAPLPLHELVLPQTASTAEALQRQLDAQQMRLDVRRAPLLAAYVAEDRLQGEWLLALLHHHIVCDHVTLELALAEVEAVLRGEGESLPEALPFRTVVAQARQTPMAEHEVYFRQELGDIDEPTAPFGVLNVQLRGRQLAQSALPLEEEVARKIRACARRNGCSPAVLFHVAWGQVLRRCTGREDVVFGTVLSGRLQGIAGADLVLGMAINTLPLRVSLGERNARQVVQETARRVQGLLEHEQAPLALAQRCSGVSSSMPLFTTLLNCRHSNFNVDEGPLSSFEGVRLLAAEEFTNYPVIVSVDDLGTGFVLRTQCIPAISAARLNDYLLTVMTGLVAALDEAADVAQHLIGVLPDHERQQLLVGFNATATEYPREALIHELFEAEAAAHPEAEAVVYEDQRLSYGELNARANQVAHYLLAQGVKPDDRVAICVERSLELVVGLLGILKAGGAYVPLDPDYPPERLAYMLGDSAPVALLTQTKLAGSVPADDIPTLVLGGSEAQAVLSSQPAHNPELRASGLTSRHLAYVIYTSGSTGTPKGVMVEHQQVLRLVMQDRYVRVDRSDGVVHCANPAFDAATWEIWVTLLHGARLIVITPACLLDAAVLGEALQRHQATVLHLTAGLFHQYVDALAPVFGRLNYLLFGGDKIDADKVRRVLKGVRPAHMVQCYGPTETTTFASMHEINGLDEQAHSVPIGRPIGNTRIYVLDSCGEPAPVGVTGEIHIGGEGVARGYLNRDELTQERFLRDPFSSDPQARMYRTGDLGHWREDGTLEFQGRNDSQVKIRGFRVELGEIQAKLAGCGGVREAVVLAREDQPGEKRLVAYWVAEEDAQVGAAELRSRLSSQLPDYMLPGAFVRLEALPLTPNGKLDRKALPAPDGASLSVRAYEAPRGEVEETLAEIWQSLLGVERVGRHDQFFELGGHSLLIVRLLMRIQECFGVELPLQALFESPSLHQQADQIVQAELALYDEQAKSEMSDALADLTAEQLQQMLTDSEEHEHT
ncbi:MAG: amino acid adenylation domain-containing protein, partial [Pseudomonadota bacterium]|nr:amino acid adenylation domain-containing protein [Pseudomonadota bacterium]